MLHGMVFKKEAEGDITSVKDAKIAVFSCPFDCMVTETKVMHVFLSAKEEILKYYQNVMQQSLISPQN